MISSSRVVLAAVILAILSGLSGCSGPKKNPGSGVTSKKVLEIAVIPKGTSHEFWKSIHAGALKAESELKDIKVIWKGPLKEDDREEQIKVVENFVTRGVDGIVLAPLDNKALVQPVKDAARQGTKVVIIDSGLESEDFVSFVATDNKEGGRKAGAHLGNLLKGKGKVVMLRYMEGSASTMDREEGFMEAIKALADIEVVSSNQFGGATTESAYKASENLLAPYREGEELAIQGIFCPNESTTFGMLRALQDAKLQGKVFFVGFDSSEKLVAALKDGGIHALVVQNPMKMGYEGVKTMVNHLRGGQVEKRIDTGVELITKATMDEPAMHDLLNPPLDKWLK